MGFTSFPLKIDAERYATIIGGFSDELCIGRDPFTKIYVGVGLSEEYLQNSGIIPYEDCLIYPLRGIAKSLINKLRRYSFEIIPLNDRFPKSLDLSENGRLVLPKEFENIEKGFVECNEVVINLTPFRRLQI
jgi:hypothetical protein